MIKARAQSDNGREHSAKQQHILIHVILVCVSDQEPTLYMCALTGKCLTVTWLKASRVWLISVHVVAGACSFIMIVGGMVFRRHKHM